VAGARSRRWRLRGAGSRRSGGHVRRAVAREGTSSEDGSADGEYSSTGEGDPHTVEERDVGGIEDRLAEGARQATGDSDGIGDGGACGRRRLLGYALDPRGGEARAVPRGGD